MSALGREPTARAAVDPIAEWQRLREADIYGVPWRRWALIWLRGLGALSARTTRPTVTPGLTFLGSRQFLGLTAGTRTAWLVSATTSSSYASRSALWNGHDPIIKERAFGLTNSQGNHGEDVKECWWYIDATPTSSWLQWRYHYPQAAFPYEDLVAENGRRSRNEPEYELVDTGIFNDGRYFVVTVTWAKDGPDDLLWQIEVRNVGPDAAGLDVLPTIWYRNRWSWDFETTRPSIIMRPGTEQIMAIDCAGIGSRVLVAPAPDGKSPEPLFCDNETNTKTLWGTPGPPYPKDGINDYLVHGASSVNPELSGTKAALRYHLELTAGATAQIRLRFAHEALDLGNGFDSVLAQRKTEADDLLRQHRTGRHHLLKKQACCARLRRGCCGASSSITTTSSHG